MVPSLSLALALSVMFAGAVNTALFAGLVMLTVGAAFTGSSVATSLPPAYMYSFTNVGVGDGGGAGALTSAVRELLRCFDELNLPEIPAPSERQQSSIVTIATVSSVRRVLDLFPAFRFKLDIAFSF